MQRPRVLFISGSIGLGHIGRDLAIARELRRQRPELEIEWLAGPPARELLEQAGETVLPESAAFDETRFAEAAAGAFSLNLMRYVVRVTGSWARGVRTVLRLTRTGRYDLVIGDETYLLANVYILMPRLKRVPFVMIYDFLGVDAVSRNPLERLLAHLLNRTWCGGRKGKPLPFDLTLFIGEPEDVPDRPFGRGLPNRRSYALRNVDFVGYPLPFDPADYADRDAVRARLGYDDRPLILCTVGGTAVGADLLRLCAAAHPLLRQRLPDARLLLVAGPRIDPTTLQAPDGVEVVGYLPRLYEHLAACDLAVVQAGGTTTLELTALQRPFLYFPLENHFEQTLVAEQLARHSAGIPLAYADTTPELLADTIERTLGTSPGWPPLPADRARHAATLLDRILQQTAVRDQPVSAEEVLAPS